jgi:glycosyltransferase involved in cell wall biosynthesis
MATTTHRKLSAVIIAYNEAHRIEQCLASLNWVDEIVVVDSGSTDATTEIARRYAQQVVTLPWRGFGPQKQAAVELASHDLVLNLDCDERVTPELALEIQALLSGETMAAAYLVPRRTFLGSKEIRHCGWYPDRTVRLFDRTRARFSDHLVHESVLVTGPSVNLRHDLLHYSFLGLADLLVKLNRYTDLSARQMFEKGKRSSLFDVTVRPTAAFVKTYLLRLGFLDGLEGFEVSLSNALSTFVKYMKLRELQQKG